MQFKNIIERLDYEFCPDEFEKREKYLEFTYLLDIFEEHITGIATHHDSLVTDVDKDVLIKKLEAFFNNDDLSELGATAQKLKEGWDPERVKKQTTLQKAKNKIIMWSYRGFDRRYVCYDVPLINRSRYQLMQYLIPTNIDNLTLIINRRSMLYEGYSSVFVNNSIFEVKCQFS